MMPFDKNVPHCLATTSTSSMKGCPRKFSGFFAAAWRMIEGMNVRGCENGVGSLFTYVMAWWCFSIHIRWNVLLSCIMHYYFLLFSLFPFAFPRANSRTQIIEDEPIRNVVRNVFFVALFICEKVVISLKTSSISPIRVLTFEKWFIFHTNWFTQSE